jgi:exodeoxyribonuclease V beta subunit
LIMPYIPIKSYEDIDITKHAIIEASAGTGKTYTIENLVVKFLNERDDLNLENILLVTFTEKATCELKLRIREKLETQLDKISDAANIKKIKNALDTFDSASIYTIHGFCQSVLRDYAFENNAPFHWEVIDDYPLFERLLKEQIRKTWPVEFGNNLSDILLISEFSRKKVNFESSVINAARFFRQNSEDQIYPDVRQLTHLDIVEKIRMMRQLVLDLKNLSVQMPFCHGFEQLNGSKPQKKILSEKFIIPLGKFLAELDSDQFSLYPLLNIISSIDEKGPEYLEIKYLKKGGPNPMVCPHWETVTHHLENLYELYLSAKDALQAMAVFQLQKDVQIEKLKNGWISFDDMLSHVQNAVCSPAGSIIVDILRKNYKVAFVDEFQDTDPVQWQIFRKIFLCENKNTIQNLLFLIGDPKQAIYAFRGADVYAYLDARQEMERFRNKGMANCYRLITNWRSEPELISLFNQLFSTLGWFAPVEECKDFEIAYLPVQAPDEDKRLFSIKKDHSERGFLNIIDLSKASSLKASKSLLAKFISEEIRHLTCEDKIICDNRKNQETYSLSYGDICVLVRGKSDMPFLEEQFNQLNIPYSFYKKPGLFLSHEAFYLSLVLHAIDEPANMTNFHKALLTPFFNFAPEDLYLTEELCPGHPVKRLLFQWHEWAFSRKWNILFQSLMEDSGLIFRESIKPAWERKHTNYCQILEHLQERVYHQNLDFRGLIALLDGYRKGTLAVGEDADLHQIETEDRKVQIMTMHVAKGLEFPVVFVFGGLTQPSNSNNNFYVYHKICGEPSKPIKIFDLSKTSTGKEEYRNESESEDKRLYYVALTRARLKLYVPCYEFNKNYPWVGPVSKLLSPALIKAFGSENNKGNNVQWLKEASSDNSKLISNIPDKLGNSERIVDRNTILSIVPPFFPQQVQFSDKIIEIASFSSLHHMASKRKQPDGITYGFSAVPKKTTKEDDESFASNQKKFIEESGDPNDIPGGTETGSMFHDILENISFEIVSEVASKTGYKTHPLLLIPQIKELIESRMEIYQIDRQWTSLVCNVILNALTTPISDLSETFMLTHLKKQDRLHEAEFYFTYPLNDEKSVPNCKVCDGFIRGFIDLIFKYKEKFYIADWKSNILEEGYDQASIERNMTQANYHLQYKIYTIAALRWFKKNMENRFDPEKHFGGIFYFYIRGMNRKNNNGIYYLSPKRLGPIEMNFILADEW